MNSIWNLCLAKLENEMVIFTSPDLYDKVKELREDRKTTVLTFDFFNEFRGLREKIQKIHSVPVIYISGNSEETNIKRAGKTNCVAFLTKPIIKEDIKSLI